MSTAFFQLLLSESVTKHYVALCLYFGFDSSGYQYPYLQDLISPSSESNGELHPIENIRPLYR